VAEADWPDGLPNLYTALLTKLIRAQGHFLSMSSLALFSSFLTILFFFIFFVLFPFLPSILPFFIALLFPPFLSSFDI
jgi:hypothetical protein